MGELLLSVGRRKIAKKIAKIAKNKRRYANTLRRSRRFDDRCDRPSSCVHVRRCAEGLAQRSRQLAAAVGASREARCLRLVLEGWGTSSSASKLGAKLWSVLLLRAAVVSVSM
jgi:hypothetical protein